MCGIAGKLYFDPSRVVDPRLLHRMQAVLAHRGPDDSGVFHDGPVGFAHRRLSIIDVTAAGHQPMSSADGQLWITFNGEIYNFLELRAELERAGVRFRSRSDTEVILELYAREGSAAVARLRGMFAFAIWDVRARELFVARDRLGKKPLCYAVFPGMFLFASEPKAILVDPEVSTGPDPLAIHHYLSFGYVPAPWSAFRGLRKLPPGHHLRVRDGMVRLERYWRVRHTPKVRGSEQELREELLTRLRDAVRARMVSDVPLGAFLSGGIDSSAVVALMAECSSRPVKTFSIGFEEERYNELPYARMVAERFATDHHEFVVKPDAVAILPELVWHYDEPYADSSAIPSYYLAKMTRQHVTVALTGDAGDENFAGYERYRANQLAVWLDRLPRVARRAVERWAGRLPDRGDPRSLYRRAKRFLGAATHEPRRRYGRWVVVLPNALKAALYTEEFAEVSAGCDSMDLLLDAYEAADTDDFLDATLAVDLATYLPGDLLVKVDIATMANSLEARAPMVDHLLVEFAAALPSSLKLRRGTKKYLLKQVMRDVLPRAVLDRPKAGFAVPIDRWFRHELRDLARDTLLSRRAVQRGLFRPGLVERLLTEHESRRHEWHPQLWSLLMLELWYQRFVDPGSPTEASVA